jgi:protocatechuate 3,4-dioxygenase beta subunit
MRLRFAAPIITLLLMSVPWTAYAIPVGQQVVTCGSGQTTPSSTAGPFYKSNPPERQSLLEEGMSGTRLVLTGRVLAADCTPLAGAVVDFWQADSNGAYDNAGYRLRGQQVADAEGGYRLETIIPGEYTGRTPHIHVTIRPAGGAPLTTQLYFAGVDRNARDFLFRPELLISAEQQADHIAGTFDFVLRG